MSNSLLLITPYTPYPLYSGGALAQYYFIDGLKEDCEMHLCTIVRSEKEIQGLNLLKDKQPRLKIHYIENFKRPSPSLKNRIKRALLFRSKNNKAAQEISDDFRDSYFHHVDHVYPESFINLINKIIREEKIDVVQFDFYDCIDIAFALPKNIRKVFIHHEVRSKRLELAAQKSSCSEEYKHFLTEKTRLFESACLRKIDSVGVFNDDDAKFLAPYCNDIQVTPFAIPDEMIFDIDHEGTFNRLLFVGSEGHNPNSLGLKWFLNEIYIPNIQRIQFPLYIIGNWSDSFKEPYTKYDKILFCGQVESIEPYFKHSIFVNCILTGAGIRTKILHSFVNKVPVLSTRFGAEGCYSSGRDNHIAFFDDAREFLIALSNSDFNELSEIGYEYYKANFNKEKLLGLRKKMLEI